MLNERLVNSAYCEFREILFFSKFRRISFRNQTKNFEKTLFFRNLQAKIFEKPYFSKSIEKFQAKNFSLFSRNFRFQKISKIYEYSLGCNRVSHLLILCSG